MHPIARFLKPLRKAAAAFFQHDVALRRDGSGLKVVLRVRAPGAIDNKGGRAAASRESLSKQKEQAELALMREQLDALLSEMPGPRQTLRHLVFVEQSLAKKGLRALHGMPLDVLQHALEQLEGLVTNWSPVGLANLRSKMAVAIIDREHMDPDAEADAYRTAAVMDCVQTPAAAADAGTLTSTDEAALTAAYALALGIAGTRPDTSAAAVELQGELDSPSAKAALRDASRPLSPPVAAGELSLRALEA